MNRKAIIRRIIKYMLAVIGVFLLYVVLGMTVPYSWQPTISEKYADSFSTESFYSDTVSVDRACIVEDNTEALELRLRMINEANKSIILSTFDFRSDESGKTVLSALLEAAVRGVKVKILVDGFSAMTHMDGNEYFEALSTHENVEIKIYNRANVLAPWRSMGRLHDKYLIVDDYAYLLGGRNTYDYFLEKDGHINYDREVLVYTQEPQNSDSSIWQIRQYFEEIWKLRICDSFCDDPEDAGKPEIISARVELQEKYRKLMENYSPEGETSYADMTAEVEKITLLSNPVHVYSKEPRVFYSMMELLKMNGGRVRIHSPYVICNDWMYEELMELCRISPEVTLMTNSVANNGNYFGASDYLSNKDELVATGVTIYEYEGGVSYHGKSITAGNSLSIVGSFNMDMRSTYLDTEVMLVIDSRELNLQLNHYMDTYEKASVKVLDEESYEIPAGVTRQEIGWKKELLLGVLRCFGWLRFLM